MTINKSNYEIYALDYLEGNLSASELSAMKSFLKDHPLIEAEIEALQADWVELQPDPSLVYERKEILLKPVSSPKVVWFQNVNIYRWSSMVAAVLLLLFGYGLGYFSAQEETQATVATRQDTSLTPEKKETLVAVATTPEIMTPKRTINPNPKLETKPSIILDTLLSSVVNNLVENQQDTTLQAGNLIDEASESVESLMSETALLAALPPKPLPPLEETSSIKKETSSHNLLAMAEKYPKITKLIDYFVERLPFQDASKAAFVPSYFLETTE
ncbi:MAG: hypothetical protein HC892_06830 [Saprospiraceae bacterium]|nr:hypothetical protein [Saprospiraceae bacterium]